MPVILLFFLSLLNTLSPSRHVITKYPPLESESLALDNKLEIPSLLSKSFSIP